VCRFKKALYMLKQTLRAWYAQVDGFLTSLRFKRNIADPNLYFKLIDEFPVILIF